MPLWERAEHALQACEDAVLAPERWPEALQLVAESAGATSSTFFYQDAPSASVPVSTAHLGFADLWLRNQHDFPDPHLKIPCRPGWDNRSWIIEHDISTEDDRKTDPYYQETAAHGKRDWWGVGHLPINGRICCLVMYRGKDNGPFTPDDGRNFARLAARLAGTVAIAERLASFTVTSVLSTLDRLRTAVIVVNDAGRAVGLNRQAESFLGQHFNLVRGRPSASDGESNRRMQCLLNEITSEKREGSGSRSPLASYHPAIICRHEAPWLLAEGMPLSAFGNDLFGCGRAILLLTDLTSSPQTNAKLLGAVFGLTPSEARLAEKIGSGRTLGEAAPLLGIGVETARTQLKMIFAKTGTQRQAQLVGVLSRLRPQNVQ